MDTNGLCLLPVWLVTLVRHGIARLQQQNFMQLQRESVNVCDSEENPQLSPVVLRQLLPELWGEPLKRVLKTSIKCNQSLMWWQQQRNRSAIPQIQLFIGVKLWAPAVSDGTLWTDYSPEYVTVMVGVDRWQPAEENDSSKTECVATFLSWILHFVNLKGTVHP